jgi:hypothetical protein
MGVWRPVIILPADVVGDASPDELEAILVHELTHLAQRDCAANLCFRVGLAMLWPQPLLHVLFRRWEMAAEDVCDRAVVAGNCGSVSYARYLLRLGESWAQARGPDHVLGMGMATLHSGLGKRVQHILNLTGTCLPALTLHARAAITLGALAIAAIAVGTVSSSAGVRPVIDRGVGAAQRLVETPIAAALKPLVARTAAAKPSIPDATEVWDATVLLAAVAPVRVELPTVDTQPSTSAMLPPVAAAQQPEAAAVQRASVEPAPAERPAAEEAIGAPEDGGAVQPQGRLEATPPAAPIVLNFDELTGMPNANMRVPEEARLSDQYLRRYGVRFRSSDPFVAVVHLGEGVAASGANALGGTTWNGALTHDWHHPIYAAFYDPAHPEYEAVTDFVSLKCDLIGHGHNVVLRAFDVNGNEIGIQNAADTGRETLSISASGIHSIVFLGSDADEGTSVDDFTFHPVTPVGRIVLDFDELGRGMPTFEGARIPDGAKISTQYASRYGITFRSGSDYASLVTFSQLGESASGYNGLGGSTPDGIMTYDSDYPTLLTFVDPAHPSRPATTDFVSLRCDTNGTKTTYVTLNAYDNQGRRIATDSELDYDGTYLHVAAPGIHTAQFIGNHGANIGASIDDVTFDVVQPAAVVRDEVGAD